MRYLTIEEVLEINAEVMSGRHVLRDRGLLESAVARPQASAFGADAYPDKVAFSTRKVGQIHCQSPRDSSSLSEKSGFCIIEAIA